MINRFPTDQTSHELQLWYLNTKEITLWAGRPKNLNYIPGRGLDMCTASRKYLRSIQTFVKWQRRAFSRVEEALTYKWPLASMQRQVVLD